MCTDYEGPEPEDKDEIARTTNQKIFGYEPKAKRIRPTDYAPILVPEESHVRCYDMRWGFYVSWDDKPRYNAKCETVTELRSFKDHTNTRCLIPARSFIEGGPKFYRPSNAIMFLAGLWRDNGEHGLHYTMLTCAANQTVFPHNERMPFVLRNEQLLEWLRGDWQSVLTTPDHSPLEKFQKQPDLF
ncbi:MAG: SOS response-associated peptidase family protein [Verrucomicrobiota bacterium]